MRTLGKPKDNLQKFKLLLSNGGKPFEYSKNDQEFTKLMHSTAMVKFCKLTKCLVLK